MVKSLETIKKSIYGGGLNARPSLAGHSVEEQREKKLI